MIACTSPAGTCSETPLRIGLPATVAWRLEIFSIGYLQDRHPELVSGSISPPAQRSPEWMLKQVRHDEEARSLRRLLAAHGAVHQEVAAHRIHRVVADAFEQALVVERLLAVVERRLLQIELLLCLLRIGRLH